MFDGFINNIKLALDIIMPVLTTITATVAVPTALFKLKEILDKNIVIKYRKILDIKKYKFMIFLCSIFSLFILPILSYIIFSLFRAFYESNIYLKIGNKKIVLCFMIAYFLLIIFIKNIILNERIYSWLKKHGLKRKRKILSVEICIWSLDIILIILFFIIISREFNNIDLIKDNFTKVFSGFLVIYIQIYFVMHLVRPNTNIKYENISDIVFYINTGNYYGYSNIDIFHTKTLSGIVSDKVILNTQEKSKILFTNYSINTTSDHICIVKGSRIVRKINKEDIVYIHLISDSGKIISKFSKKEILNFGIFYNDKIVKKRTFLKNKKSSIN